MIRVGVAGAAGRMGTAACAAVLAAQDMELAGRADPALGTTLASILGDCDVVIDFTQPAAALGNARECVAAGVHVVIGTTGFDLAALEGLSGANIFAAPNFAIGAVLMMRFAAEAARYLPAAEVVELHHAAKVDRPSGTAKLTAELMGGDVPIHSVRLPGLNAHQEVILGGEGETLRIRHDAISREAYTPGVLLALERLSSLPPGLTVGLDTLI